MLELRPSIIAVNPTPNLTANKFGESWRFEVLLIVRSFGSQARLTEITGIKRGRAAR